MKKFCLLLIIGILSLCVGCSGNKNNTQSNSSIDNPVATVESQQGSPKKSSGKSTNSMGYQISAAYNFSEGRAWVVDSNVNSAKAYVIDTQGQIIWESPVNNSSSFLVPSGFKDGLSYFGINPNVHGQCKSYSIIDSDGNITYTNDSENFRILGYGNGRFFVTEHVESFDTNEWRFGTIDKHGNAITPLKPYYIEYVDEDAMNNKPNQSKIEELRRKISYTEEAIAANDENYTRIIEEEEEKAENAESEWENDLAIDNINKTKEFMEHDRNKFAEEIAELQAELEPLIQAFDDSLITYNTKVELSGDTIQCSFYGDNIFRIVDNQKGLSILINAETESVILDDASWYMRFLTDFENGYAYVTYDGSFFKFKTDGSLYDGIQGGPSEDMEFSEGLAFVQNYGVYVKLNGEVAIDFPEYIGKNAYTCGPFHNGNAVMIISGADGFNYFTVINSNGDKLFEPIKDEQSGDAYRGNYYLSQDGEYILIIYNRSIYVLDKSGNMLVSVHGVGFQKEPFYGMDESYLSSGMLRVGEMDMYVNVADKSVLGSNKDIEVKFH